MNIDVRRCGVLGSRPACLAWCGRRSSGAPPSSLLATARRAACLVYSSTSGPSPASHQGRCITILPVVRFYFANGLSRCIGFVCIRMQEDAEYRYNQSWARDNFLASRQRQQDNVTQPQGPVRDQKKSKNS